MERAKDRIDFNRLVAEIEEDRVLLPDFQRRFAWTDAGIQIKLVASVLCKMPIGSILFLKTPAMDFAARRIGSNMALPVVIEKEERDFLLDGQQRITVMVNAFSDLIHENGQTEIDSLKRRFFLGVPKPGNGQAEDPFGFRRLIFPLEDPEYDTPDFMTEEVARAVIVKPFKKSDTAAYNPYGESGKSLLAFCLGYEGYYLIPLYLLVRRREESKRDRNRRLLRGILEVVSGERGRQLLEELEAGGPEAQDMWLSGIIRDGQMLRDIRSGEKFLEREIEKLARDWSVGMERYLVSCIQGMNLHIIGTPNSNREKAIEIFENLNSGGAKLSTFDLVMARAARADRAFREHFRRECGRERLYPAEFVPEKVRLQFDCYLDKKRKERESYHALRELGCIGGRDGEPSLRLQDAFLNVLALKCHDGENSGSKRKYRTEYSRNSILGLEAREIADGYGQVCEALDRGAFFLHVRGGVRNIAEVNYHLMYTVLSYLFLDREIYENRRSWNLLTAWYWCAIFSGRYDKDQNVQAERDIGFLWELLHGKGDMGYLWEMYEKAFKMPLFSEKDFLLYRESAGSRVYPKEVLGRYLCQYLLVDGYPDPFNRELRICAFPYTEELEDLERHHIIPLMCSQSVKASEQRLAAGRDKKCIQNSPLNVTLITGKANRKIAAQNVADYVNTLQSGAAKELGLLFPESWGQDADIEDILGNRFEWIKGKLKNDMQCWVGPV